MATLVIMDLKRPAMLQLYLISRYIVEVRLWLCLFRLTPSFRV